MQLNMSKPESAISIRPPQPMPAEGYPVLERMLSSRRTREVLFESLEELRSASPSTGTASTPVMRPPTPT